MRFWKSHQDLGWIFKSLDTCQTWPGTSFLPQSLHISRRSSSYFRSQTLTSLPTSWIYKVWEFCHFIYIPKEKWLFHFQYSSGNTFVTRYCKEDRTSYLPQWIQWLGWATAVGLKPNQSHLSSHSLEQFVAASIGVGLLICCELYMFSSPLSGKNIHGHI